MPMRNKNNKTRQLELSKQRGDAFNHKVLALLTTFLPNVLIQYAVNLAYQKVSFLLYTQIFTTSDFFVL